MKTKLQLIFAVFFGVLGFSQSLKPVAKEVADSKARKARFEQFTLFTKDNSTQKMAKYQQAARDISVLKLNKSQLSEIINQKPEALEMTYPFENGLLTVELVKADIFSNEFNLNTDKGKVENYTPGVYYRGIIKGDANSLVAFSFFNDDVVGIASVKNGGNIVLGKALDSEDFVVYDDRKMSGKSSFICGTDELMENQRRKISYDPVKKAPEVTANCVRMYYEVANKPYKNNGSNVTTTTNWITAVHNNINTLYVNDGVKMSLKSVYIWTTADPYTGDYNQNLYEFSELRPTFDGDLAHLVNSPSTTSVAFLNSLCTTYKHAYSGIDQTYSNVPAYSWTIGAMTHEMGHSLGSPHTHACAWNGNNTAIDGCGPMDGYYEGCDGPIPDSGTIMSYCHLNVGISFANGFGPQPAALIRGLIDTKACLGSDCINTCPITVSGLMFANINKTGFIAVFNDESSNSWKYKVTKMDGTVVKSATVNSREIVINDLLPNTYYKLFVGTNFCSTENAYQTENIFLTDDDWCGKTFTDSGGLTGNYSNAETFEKTFYPDSPGQKLKLTFTSLRLEEGYDFLTIKNGPDSSSPNFPNGANLTGIMNPGSFTSTHSTGAITVVFKSDTYVTDSGWEAKFSCNTLGVSDVDKNAFSVSPNPVKDNFKILGNDKIKSVDIFDNSGKQIKTFDTSVISANQYDVSKLPKGTYLIIIKTENETVTKKLIK